MSENREDRNPSVFEPLVLRRLSELIGPIDVQWEPSPVFEATVRDEHSNSMSRAHGGFIASLIDIATGQGVKRILHDDRSLVTVTANIEYLGAARVRDRLRAEIAVVKDTPSLVFAKCMVSVRGKSVASASAVFSARPK